MIASIAIALICTGLMFVAYRKWRYNTLVNSLFGRGKPLDLSIVSQQIDLVNQDSTEFTFAANRAIAITVFGRMVHLVEGPVGHVVYGIRNPFWHTQHCLFAITDSSRIEWYYAHKHVFREAMIGERYSIFWAAPEQLL